MIWLLLGVALWWGAHLFKRAAPRARARMGDAGKGAVAATVLASLALMIVGYRMAEGAVYWDRTPALAGVNNLLMLAAFYVFGASMARGGKVWLGTKLRHPMLTGFALWALAHLAVNGDAPSFVLFGGLLAWALVEIVAINSAEGAWTPPPRAPARKEFTLAAATVALFVVVAVAHAWLGYPPFG